MAESTPPEGQHPLTQGQLEKLRRSLTERILDRAESDPEWKQLLLEDPELAMREANFLEAQQLGQQGLPMRPQEREVVGQGGGLGYGGAPLASCFIRRVPGSSGYGRWTFYSRCVQQTLFRA